MLQPSSITASTRRRLFASKLGLTITRRCPTTSSSSASARPYTDGSLRLSSTTSTNCGLGYPRFAPGPSCQRHYFSRCALAPLA